MTAIVALAALVLGCIAYLTVSIALESSLQHRVDRTAAALARGDR